jgi:hypothetical protein
MVSVHDGILSDMLYPVDVVGRRWRHKTDGSRQTKIFLDVREKDKVEGKLETYSVVYKKLTGIDVSFGFMTKYVIYTTALFSPPDLFLSQSFAAAIPVNNKWPQVLNLAEGCGLQNPFPKPKNVSSIFPKKIFFCYCYGP